MPMQDDARAVPRAFAAAVGYREGHARLPNSGAGPDCVLAFGSVEFNIYARRT